MYQANLLKKIVKNAVYRLRTNGHFVLVTGYCYLKKGKDEDVDHLHVQYIPVAYFRIPSDTPHLEVTPVFGLRVKASDQAMPHIRDEKEFRDMFFFHQSEKDRPKIRSVVSDNAKEILNKKIVNGDQIAT